MIIKLINIGLILFLLSSCEGEKKRETGSFEIVGLDSVSNDISIQTGLTEKIQKNRVLYLKFEDAKVLYNEDAFEWYANAEELRLESEKIGLLIDSLKGAILGESQDEPKESSDGATKVMIEEGGGIKLRIRIDTLKIFITEVLSEHNTNEVEKDLLAEIEKLLDTYPKEDFDTKSVVPWESWHFEYLPLMAVMTILEKIRMDVINAEYMVLSYLHAKMSLQLFKEDSAAIK